MRQFSGRPSGCRDAAGGGRAGAGGTGAAREPRGRGLHVGHDPPSRTGDRDGEVVRDARRERAHPDAVGADHRVADGRDQADAAMAARAR